MRTLLTLVLSATALAQPAPQTQTSHTTESLRGVSAVSRNIAWASGTHGTYLRTTDAGRTWIPAQVPGAESLDFRAVVAFSATEAFLMSAGPGDQSRIYRTSPTNLGLSLLANLAAYDFGYITAGQFAERTANTFQTMERLERYRGHFFNWYDTQ